MTWLIIVCVVSGVANLVLTGLWRFEADESKHWLRMFREEQDRHGYSLRTNHENVKKLETLQKKYVNLQVALEQLIDE